MAQGKVTQVQEKTPPRAWAILAVTFFASFMAPIAQFKLPPLASWLIPQYGLDSVTFGYLMSALALVGLILAFPAAFISRGFGLKNTVLLSIASLIVGTVISVLGSDVAFIYVGRLIEGVGIGLIGVAAPSCVSLWFPEKTRGLALGIWATWMPLGQVLVFNTAPTIAANFGWQSVFWISAALSAVAFVLFLLVFKMPESEEGASELGNVTFKECLPYAKYANIWILGLVFFGFNFVQLGPVNSFYNIFLENVRGFDPQGAASVASTISLACIFLIPIFGAISGRVSHIVQKYFICAGCLFAVVGFLFGFKTGDAADANLIIYIVSLMLVGGILGGFIRPMVPTLMGNSVAAVAMGMGILQFTQNLGGVVGPAAFGWGIEALGWDGAAVFVVVPMCIVGAVAALFIINKNTRQASEVIAEREAAKLDKTGE